MKTETTGNITKGQSSTKMHLRNGAGTICKNNTLNKEAEEDFVRIYEEYPGMCCAKCVAYLKERNRL